VREAALEALEIQPLDVILGPLGELLLADSTPEVQAACLDLLERRGAAVSMNEIRTDGWFDRIGEQVQNFDAICTVMGHRFLAYAIILGIQVRSLASDPRVPANSTVDFTLGDDQIQTLALGEFRIRVVQSILRHPREPRPLALPLTVDGAAAQLGGRLLLLAPLFDISLEQLIVSDADPETPQLLVGYFSAGGYSIVTLPDFEQLVLQKVRRDLAGTAEQPFQLDLQAVELARRAAADGQHEQVISALQNWPGLLSVLQRTPTFRELDPEQRSLIGEGLELLGEAFAASGRASWTEELFRLGLNFVREGEAAGRLFCKLGQLLGDQGRHGEAIGLLRRAEALGVAPELVLPALGRAFLHSGKLVPARALLELAATRGWPSPGLEQDLEDARRRCDERGLMWDVPVPPEGEGTA
jgi:hypothetical protein